MCTWSFQFLVIFFNLFLLQHICKFHPTQHIFPMKPMKSNINNPCCPSPLSCILKKLSLFKVGSRVCKYYNNITILKILICKQMCIFSIMFVTWKPFILWSGGGKMDLYKSLFRKKCIIQKDIYKRYLFFLIYSNLNGSQLLGLLPPQESIVKEH